MLIAGILIGCLSSLILAGAIEKRAIHRAWKAVPIRIQVNGTRGKSTVTRLIRAALLQAGFSVLAKTTGTAPRLLLPDGTEQPLSRRGRPNIREQIWLLRQACAKGVQAVVTECMAVHPALQWTVEKEIMHSTIGVITNVRTDHREAMGRSPEEIARSLANTIPNRGILVLGEEEFAPLFREIAKRLQTIVVEAPFSFQDKELPYDHPATDQKPAWLQQSYAVALAVTRQLGIPDQIALSGMEHYRPDPGATHRGTLVLHRKEVPFLDFRAANDPESFQQLIKDYYLSLFENDRKTERKWILIYNHRTDRPERLRAFLNYGSFLRLGTDLLVCGDPLCWTLAKEMKKALNGACFPYVPTSRLVRYLEEPAHLPDGMVFCGNSRGLDPWSLRKGLQ